MNHLPTPPFMARLVLLASLLMILRLATPIAQAQTAAEVREATGVTAGLIVHLAATDGMLEITLAQDGRVLAQGLTLEPAVEAAAREAAAGAGVEGLVTFEHVESFQTLPYNDNLVTLLIADLDALGAAAPSREEILRVVSPYGHTYLRTGGKWVATQKPLPATMDDWTHHDHSPDGNAQSTDELVATPRGVQWFVSGGGRMQSGLRLAGGVWVQSGKFSVGDTRSTFLDGRNAFNGLLLWRSQEDQNTSGARGLQDSTLCTDGQRIYGILDEPFTAKAWDLATGEELVVYEEGLTNRGSSDDWNFRKTPLSLHHMILGDRLVQASGEGKPDVAVLHARTGKRLWDWTADDGLNVGLTAAKDGIVFVGLTRLEGHIGYHYGNKLAALESIVALDLETGRQLWSNDDVKGSNAFNLVAAEGAVFLASNNVKEGKRKPDIGAYSHLVRIDATSGRTVFKKEVPELGVPSETSWNYKLRYHEGMLLPAFGGAVVAFDAKTGELADKPYVMPTKMYQDPPLFCSTIRGTAHGLLTGKFARFVDLRDGSFSAVSIGRSGCDRGSYPAYGQIYTGDDGCGCTSWLRGFISMHARDYSDMRVPDNQRLVRGPAYSDVGKSDGDGEPQGWAMMLGGPDRMAYSPTRVGSNLAEVWKIEIPSDIPNGTITADWDKQNDILGVITPPVVSGDTAYLASTHQGRVYAIDIKDGKTRWTFPAGGRIDSPPTLYHGVTYFGCRDGYVYALRARDGALLWKFLAAPDRRQMANSGQLENANPLYGSVMIHGGRLFANAGRHNQADGGIQLWRLDPATGQPEASTAFAGQGNSQQPDDAPARGDGQGRVNDLLATTGKGKYLSINRYTIHPGTLNWVSGGIAEGGGVFEGIDQSDRSILATSFNNAVGTMDRRSDSIGSKGGGGFLYGTRSRKDIVTGQRIVRAGDRVFAVSSKGDLYRYPLDADAMPIQRDKDDKGEKIAKIPGSGTLWAMAATPGEVVVARGSDVFLFNHDGEQLQQIKLPADLVAYGIAIDENGRLYLSCNDGSLHVYAGK